MGTRAGLDGRAKSRPTGLRSPDRPAHSYKTVGILKRVVVGENAKVVR